MKPRKNRNLYVIARFVAHSLSWLTVAVFASVASIGAFSGGMWGGVGIGFGLILFLGVAWLDQRWPRPSHELFGLAAATLTAAALLNLGSSSPSISWCDWARLATIFLPLVLLSSPELLSRAENRRLFTVMILAAFVGAIALGTELFLNAPVLHMTKGEQIGLTKYNRGISYLVVLALPVMASLWTRPLTSTGHVFGNKDDGRQMPLPFADDGKSFWRRWSLKKLRARFPMERMVPFFLFVLAMLYPASLTESRASKLAFVAATLTVVAAKLAPRFTSRALKSLVFILILWPFAATQGFEMFHGKLAKLPDSWRARVEIWDYMSHRIFEHPFLGWGLGTSKTLDFANPNGHLYTMVTQNAPHPHNVVLQLWVELGLPGVALGIAFALATLHNASRLSKPLAPFAMGAWVAALCLALVAYNFWTDSMFATFALTGFAFVLLERQVNPPPALQRIRRD